MYSESKAIKDAPSLAAAFASMAENKNGLWMTADGTSVKEIGISGASGHSLLGIKVGMSTSEAQSILMPYTMLYSSGDSAEYIVTGTANDWEILLDIDYSNGSVVSVDYGTWS